MLDNSPESRNLLAASSKVFMLLEETVVLWNFVEDTTLLPDWSCSFDTSGMKFLKIWKHELLVHCSSIFGYQYKPNSYTRSFAQKHFWLFFFFVYKSNYSSFACCTFKSFSSRNICKWFKHEEFFTLVYCRYFDKYSLLNNFVSTAKKTLKVFYNII